MATPNTDFSGSVYRIKITLGDVEPPVWRRVEIEDCSLEILHEVIQGAMGWDNYHLYEFVIDEDTRYTDARAAESEKEDAAKVTLKQLVEKRPEGLLYVYDMGDAWKHTLEFEAIGSREAGVHYPRCIEGQRACPPEDCGGAPGYARMLEVLADPDHREYDDYVEQIGEEFDAEAFDAERVNQSWQGWDFNDPDSGPIFAESFDDAAPPVPTKLKDKAEKAKSKPKESKLARNDPCPCGSGKKFKKCCMKGGKDGDYEDA